MNDDPSVGGVSQRIYLAGPIDQTDDPWTWRDRAKDLAPGGVELVDPLDRFQDWPEDGRKLIEWDLRQAASCDVLAGAMGSAPTTGTHYEIERAIMNGNRVVVHLADPDEVSKFLRKRPEVETTESLEEAVRLLTEPAERRAVADD